MPIDAKLMAAGARHERAGRFQQALDVYGQLLAAHPGEALLLCASASACLGLKKFDEASRLLDDALRLEPASTEAQVNRGRLMSAQGRFAEAAQSFRNAAALDPRNTATQLKWAEALASAGEPVAAIEILSQTVRLAPDSVQALQSLGRLLAGQDRHAEALEPLRRAAELLPDQAAAHLELGATLIRLGRKSEAIGAYQAALRLKPNSAEGCLALSWLYNEQKQFDEAVRWARRTLELDPDSAEAHHNLGSALSNQERYDEARCELETAIRLKPEMKDAFINLGIVDAAQDRFDDALADYRRALALDPHDPVALFNLGNAAMAVGYLPDALASYERAIALHPDSSEAHFMRAAIWLLQEKLESGFAELEWRLRLPEHPVPELPWPIWRGEPLAGRTIVLFYEQGLGDTLQFVRYASLLKQQGARVVVACDSVLLPILSRTPGVDAWLPADSAPCEADFGVFMMSLPHLMGKVGEAIPAPVPYVFADPALVEKWRQRLRGLDGLKVGIVWQGNRKYLWDRHRSIPLVNYSPLAKVPGVRLVNLQKGHGIEQLAPLADAWRITDYSREIDEDTGPFMDTAAVMKNLDLVITSDTAAAHLAGALGVPTWMAVHLVPDWRWFLDREDSPWYPTMRIFRQKKLNDWSEVFERIASELERSVLNSGRGS